MDSTYKTYQQRRKEAQPSTEDIQAIGQRLVDEINEGNELNGIDDGCSEGKKEPLMQLMTRLLLKNHHLE